jgi:ketosteroid isomerase-like protein
MSLLEKQQKILDQLANGQFVEGMEEFYADDAVNEEPTGVRIEGKAAIIENEHKVLEAVEAFHGLEVRSVGSHDDGNGNGVTFAEYSLRVDMKDGTKFNPDQVQVTRWENGLARHIRFYYNPNF